MVQGVYVLVHRLDVDEAVSEVKVKFSVEGNPEGSQYELGQVPSRGERLLICHEGDLSGGAAMDKYRLPHCVLDNPQESVPHVVHDFVNVVTPVCLKWPL